MIMKMRIQAIQAIAVNRDPSNIPGSQNIITANANVTEEMSLMLCLHARTYTRFMFRYEGKRAYLIFFLTLHAGISSVC